MDSLHRPARLTVIESSSIASSSTSSTRNPASRLQEETRRNTVKNSRDASVLSTAPSQGSTEGNHSSQTTTSAKSSSLENTFDLNGNSEEAKLIRAEKRKKEILRRGEKWSDKFMEEVLDGIVEFKKGLRYITPAQYALIIHERHLNSLCSYPPCHNQPSAEYRPGKRFVISSRNRTITETMGNAEEGFCSKTCKARNGWVEKELEKSGSVLRRGRDWDLELMEEFEARNGFDANSNHRGELGRQKATFVTNPRIATSTTSSTRATVPPVTEPTNSTILRKALTKAPQLESQLAASSSDPTSLLAKLTIHERPIPNTPVRTPSSDPLSIANANTPGENSIIPPNRREASSLFSTPARLANTVLQASKKIGVNQLDPDTDDDEVDIHLQWEKEVGLGWGDGEDEEDIEGNDLKAIWEEARKVKAMMDNDGG